MRAILAGLVAEGTAIVAGGDGRAWQIRRIRSADLAGAGLAELVGAVAADEAVRDLQAEYRLATGADPVALAAIQARAQEAQAAAAARKLASDPRALAAVADRLDRTVCAGVVGVGDAPSDAVAGAVVVSDVEPVTLTMAHTTDADHEAGRVWVGMVPEDVRMVLFDAIESLSGATKIRPFRGVAGDPPTA